MSKELDRRPLPQKGDVGHEVVDPVFPASPQQVPSLVIDYTSMTMEDLKNVKTLIGGGNGPVVKLDPDLLQEEETARKALEQLVRALMSYPCNMLFLLVPWGMPGVEPVLEVMTKVGRQSPFVVFAIGRELYSIELSMTIDPLSEGDAELRQDAEANAPETQWAVRQPWIGEDIAGMIDRIQGGELG